MLTLTILILLISIFILIFSLLIGLQYKGKINLSFLQTIDFYISNYKSAKIAWLGITFFIIGFSLFWLLDLIILISIL